ncbi:MAG: AzlD domain-containing protein [Kiritimatiellae bacterium]|nr:AzlD domain-containing protein [Kiritimatiellia bacterium]
MTQRALLALVLGVALANYALRVLPLALLRRPLRNPRLVAFVERLPYAILAAMVVPDVFSAETAGDARASAAGFAVALALSLLGRSLPFVAAAATAAAFAVRAAAGA